MLTPGFIIKNETQWPIQIALGQVGPLYWEIVPPGGSFTRDTGAVWFSIRAELYFEGHTPKITEWDAVIPVAAFSAQVLMAIATGGAAAYGGVAVTAAYKGLNPAGGGLGPLDALAEAAMLGLSAGVSFSGNSSTLLKAQTYMIKGMIMGSQAVAHAGGVNALLKEIFSEDNTCVKVSGKYAGPPYPFRSNLKTLYIKGGPRYVKKAIPGNVILDLIDSPLELSTVAYNEKLETKTKMMIQSKLSDKKVLDLAKGDKDGELIFWDQHGGKNQVFECFVSPERDDLFWFRSNASGHGLHFGGHNQRQTRLTQKLPVSENDAKLAQGINAAIDFLSLGQNKTKITPVGSIRKEEGFLIRFDKEGYATISHANYTKEEYAWTASLKGEGQVTWEKLDPKSDAQRWRFIEVK